MKRIVLIASGVAALTSGCASTTSNTQAAYDDGVDYRKVAVINTVARQRGVEVHWINFPQRKTTSPEVVPTLGGPTGS